VIAVTHVSFRSGASALNPAKHRGNFVSRVSHAARIGDAARIAGRGKENPRRSNRGIVVTVIASLALTFALAGCEKSKTPAGSGAGTAGGAAGASADLPEVPLGLDPVPIPDDNPMTAAKVELGKLLYFDTHLSKGGTISCTTCHDPKMGWAEHKPTSVGIHEQVGDRNSPTVINAAHHKAQFWDGRAASLEEQALGPIENPIEMGHTMDAVIGDLEKNAEYQKRRVRDRWGEGREVGPARRFCHDPVTGRLRGRPADILRARRASESPAPYLLDGRPAAQGILAMTVFE
jgi:hypothetical protein